jgi:hypothetical protein
MTETEQAFDILKILNVIVIYLLSAMKCEVVLTDIQTTSRSPQLMREHST